MAPPLPASSFRQHLSLHGHQQELLGGGGGTALVGAWGQEGAKSARSPSPVLSLERRGLKENPESSVKRDI